MYPGSAMTGRMSQYGQVAFSAQNYMGIENARVVVNFHDGVQTMTVFNTETGKPVVMHSSGYSSELGRNVQGYVAYNAAGQEIKGAGEILQVFAGGVVAVKINSKGFALSGVVAKDGTLTKVSIARDVKSLMGSALKATGQYFNSMSAFMRMVNMPDEARAQFVQNASEITAQNVADVLKSTGLAAAGINDPTFIFMTMASMMDMKNERGEVTATAAEIRADFIANAQQVTASMVNTVEATEAAQEVGATKSQIAMYLSGGTYPYSMRDRMDDRRAARCRPSGAG